MLSCVAICIFFFLADTDLALAIKCYLFCIITIKIDQMGSDRFKTGGTFSFENNDSAEKCVSEIFPIAPET